LTTKVIKDLIKEIRGKKRTVYVAKGEVYRNDVD